MGHPSAQALQHLSHLVKYLKSVRLKRAPWRKKDNKGPRPNAATWEECWARPGLPRERRPNRVGVGFATSVERVLPHYTQSIQVVRLRKAAEPMIKPRQNSKS
ncbi:hypothetical protein CR513_26558, partial [Mucuna pruriens]